MTYTLRLLKHATYNDNIFLFNDNICSDWGLNSIINNNMEIIFRPNDVLDEESYKITTYIGSIYTDIY